MPPSWQVGCDVVETDTFGATRIVLAEYGLQDKVAEINRRGGHSWRARWPRILQPAEPRFVAGSIGPTTKLPSLGHISFDAMAAAYVEQARR